MARVTESAQVASLSSELGTFHPSSQSLPPEMDHPSSQSLSLEMDHPSSQSLSLEMDHPSNQSSSHFQACLDCLQLMATDHNQFPLAVKDAIFLDDIILRLRLWAADVRGDERLEELLDWVDKLQAVRAMLHELLSQLDEQLKTIEASLRTVISVDSIKESLPEASTSEFKPTSISETSRKDLLEAVQHLVAYTAPIKTASSVHKQDRTETRSLQINSSVRSQSFPELPRSIKATYFVLKHMIPGNSTMVDRLLGAVIKGVQSFDGPLSGDDKIKEKLEAEHITVNRYTKENYSIGIESILAKVLQEKFTNRSGANLEAHASADVTTGSASLSASYSKLRASGHTINSPRVTTYFINPTASYVNWASKKYLEAFRKTVWILPRSCYLIVGVKTIYEEAANAEWIFAIQVRKIKIWPFKKAVELEDKPFTKGAIL